MIIKLFIFLSACYIVFPLSAQLCNPEPNHTGEGTYYSVDQSTVVNCSYDLSTLAGITQFYIGAMNHTDYDASNACGACALVTGPYGDQITVKIVDQCPECAPGDIDFSPEAFEQLAPLIEGRIDISWEYVPCPLSDEKIKLRYKDGSSQYWMGVNVFDTKNRIVSIEGKSASVPDYVALERQTYNYFEYITGLGQPPHTFRITDVYGNEVEMTTTKIEATQDVVVESDVQFDDCQITAMNEIEEELDVTLNGNKLIFGETGNYTVEIYNLLGQLVSSKVVESGVLHLHKTDFQLVRVYNLDSNIRKVFKFTAM